jgi:hypothetical protein
MDILNSYKQGQISLEEAIKNLDLANTTNDKKTEGVIYTPKYIADHIVSGLGYNPEKTIIEPSVGHGVFVFSLIEYVEKAFELKGSDLKEWFESKVFCFDVNVQNIADLKNLLTIYFEKKDILNVSYDNLQVSDTLFFNFEHGFDFAFGNPPYIRTKNLEESYLEKLRSKYKSCETGNVDIYYAFMELMSKISDISSFIVPNSYIYNKSAKALRKELKPTIESIIDFKSKLIFDNARTYTSIYKTNKLIDTSKVKYKEDLTKKEISVNKESLEDNHWFFSELDSNKEGKSSIVNLYSCYGSIATLKDKIYLIESPREEKIGEQEYYIQRYNDVDYKIEKELCVDFYKITKMNKSFKIIYPYKDDKILPEEELKSKFPFAYEYFLSMRPELDQRDKGKVDKYESWYAYGRKQGLNKKKEKCFLFLPLMATQEYVCHKILKEDEFMISSGFVLGFKTEEEADKIKQILESGEFFDYIKLKGKPWAGKNPYYSFSKTHLKDFYV